VHITNQGGWHDTANGTHATITGAALGSATVYSDTGTAPADIGDQPVTVIAGPSAALRSNEPTGMTQFTYRPMTAFVEDNWTDHSNLIGSNESIVTDNAAPEGNQVYDILFPAKLKAGDTPVDQFKATLAANTYSEVYVAFYVWMASGFVNEASGVQKVFYATDDSASGSEKPSFYISMQNGLSSTFPITPEIRVQADDTFNMKPNVSGHTNDGFNLNTWNKVQFRIRQNTPGHADGVMQLWLNNVKNADYSNVAYHLRGSTQWHWVGSQLRPYWGGCCTDSVPANQHMRINRLYISVKP
jgi:archaellin